MKELFCSKGFTAGLITGAVVGGICGMVMDPIKDKETKKIRKNAGNIIRSVGNIVDGFSDMHS